jgi:hypothetical protein
VVANAFSVLLAPTNNSYRRNGGREARAISEIAVSLRQYTRHDQSHLTMIVRGRELRSLRRRKRLGDRPSEMITYGNVQYRTVTCAFMTTRTMRMTVGSSSCPTGRRAPLLIWKFGETAATLFALRAGIFE